MNQIVRLIARTFTDTPGVAQDLIAMRLNRGILWSSFLVIVCLSVLLFFVGSTIAPVGEDHVVAQFSPFMLALILGAVLILMVFALFYAGRMLGGTARFGHVLLMMIWLQIMAFALQLIQLAFYLIVPALLTLVSFVSTIFLFYALLQFVRVVHGFNNILMAFVTVVVASLGSIFGMAIVASVLGMTGQGLS